MPVVFVPPFGHDGVPTCCRYSLCLVPTRPPPPLALPSGRCQSPKVMPIVASPLQYTCACEGDTQVERGGLLLRAQ